MMMTQQDFIGVSSDTLAVIFTGLQTNHYFQLACLALTIISIIAGIVLKVISVVKQVKAGKVLTEDEKDAKIAELTADLAQATNSLEKMNGIFESASKALPMNKKGR